MSEQIVLVRALRRSGVLFCAVPNGGYRLRKEARLLKASGVSSGVPDLLIFDSPPLAPEKRGVALELKRAGKGGRVSKEQKVWLESLEARGWVSFVARGAREAIERLQELGYGV